MFGSYELKLFGYYHALDATQRDFYCRGCAEYLKDHGINIYGEHWYPLVDTGHNYWDEEECSHCGRSLLECHVEQGEPTNVEDTPVTDWSASQWRTPTTGGGQSGERSVVIHEDGTIETNGYAEGEIVPAVSEHLNDMRAKIAFGTPGDADADGHVARRIWYVPSRMDRFSAWQRLHERYAAGLVGGAEDGK